MSYYYKFINTVKKLYSFTNKCNFWCIILFIVIYAILLSIAYIPIGFLIDVCTCFVRGDPAIYEYNNGAIKEELALKKGQRRT